jgi:glutamate dehydrogenase (NAD(P)+)
MEDGFEFADHLGPAKVVHIFEPKTELKAILVIDNVACGPSIGGVRMAPNVSLEECFRLARAMTFKNATAGLPHGGGKSVIFADPKMPDTEKEDLIRVFARSIGPFEDYIVGPDMGTNERCMAWVKDEIGRSVGLPREIGGIPLDEIGATGFGLAVSVEVAQDFCDLELEGARIAVQGFGSVGRHAARFLARKGAILVAAADSGGTLVDANGIDVDALITTKDEGGSVIDHGSGEALGRDAVIDVECEVWVPCARPDVLRTNNVARLRTKLVAQGANIPVSVDAERMLHETGVLCIPDFIANAGGVICAAVEYRGDSERAAFAEIEEKVRRNTRAALAASADSKETPRQAATALAEERVRSAMRYRRWS